MHEPTSPITLHGATPHSAPRLVTDPWSGDFQITHTGTTLSLVPEEGACAVIGAARWALREVHVHHPSEHALPDVDAVAEFHLVHRDEAEGFLVIGVLAVVADGGGPHPAVDAFLADAPVDESTADGTAPFAPYELLPSDRTNLRYVGSLTTPPFTPGVNWVCMAQPISITRAQLIDLRSRFPQNALARCARGDRPLHTCG